ncbi:MAG: hypothetical protein ACTSV1_02350 [Alphaproteobacteria bacterium]
MNELVMSTHEPPLSPTETMRLGVLQIDDLASGGEIVSVEPDMAEMMSAFIEDALDVGEAIISNLDVDAETGLAIFDENDGVTL